MLRDIAGMALSSSQASPVSGSVMAVESARDEDIGDADLPTPFQFAHTIHRALVYAAGERLVTLSWCIESDPYPHVMSATELARAAAEAASLGVWLGDREADGDVRLRRLLGLLAVSAREEVGLRRELDLEPVAADGTQLALKWGQNRGMAHEPPGSKTRLLLSAQPESGGADYRRLSAVAHSTLFALIGTWIEVVAAQSGRAGPIQVHSLLTSVSAARYVLAGIDSTFRTSGRSTSDVEESASRLREIEASILEMAVALDWELP